MLLLTALCLGLALLQPAPESPRLRHVAFVGFVPAGRPIQLRLASLQHSTVYGEGLRWGVVVGAGEVVRQGSLRLKETTEVRLEDLAERLHVVQLESGWNLSTIAIEGAPWAVVCHAELEVTVIGEARFFCYQAPGKPARLDIGASVTHEGCRVQLVDADGTILADEDGDLDKPQAFALPAVDEPRVVELRILKPETPGLNLDDVEIRLRENLAPYLAPTPEFARTMGERWQQWLARSSQQ